MNEQWKELKETITELRDNDGTDTQQEICKFLVNYMGVLENQMVKQKPCDDAISRQAVINAIENDCMRGGLGSCFASYDDAQKFRGEIEQLPSVTQKSGKWIKWLETENIPHCKCSECDTEYDIFASRFINYCPNCGAKMESEDKE